MEEWKWIKYKNHDFTGKYMISNTGKVKSIDRYTEKQHQFHKGQEIKSRKRPSANTSYECVTLWDDGKQFDVEIHRLVATAFLDNPEGKPCINHKDGNGSNNNIENLEWCTHSENARHSVEILGHNPAKWKSKKVIQKTTDGEIVRVWDSAWQIQRETGFCQVSISRCCRRQKKSGEMYGFIWDFEGR